jgi:hypothetical protein
MYLFKRISSLTLGLLGCLFGFQLSETTSATLVFIFTFFGPCPFASGFGLFELGLELVGLAPLFLIAFLIIHNIP